MQYQEYRNWLAARGVSGNAVNTGSAAVKRIEKVLAKLGSPHADPDTAFRQYNGGGQALQALKVQLCH
jgi:hypothetical protein